MKYKGYVPVILVILLVILSFLLIKPFLEAILFGALLAYAAYPLYKWLSKKTNLPSVSALLVCLVILLIIIIPGFFLANALVQQSYNTFMVMKEKFSTGIFTTCELPVCRSIEGLLQVPEVKTQLQIIINSITVNLVQKGSEVLFSLPRLFLNLFVMFFALFYFLKGGEQFLHKVSDYFSMQKKEARQIISRSQELVHGVVYGYLLVALIQGALGALGFWAFGVSSPLLWGVVMALLALIPILGTGFVWVPASLLMVLEGIAQSSNSLLFRGIGLFLYGLLIVSTIDNILKPKIMGDQAKVHPLIILLGIFGGLLLFGPLGVFIGPLVLSFTYVIVDNYLKRKKKK